MSLEETISLVVVLAFAVPAWLLFLRGVPRIQTSQFRYRLWRLRDDLVRDVYSGDLPANDHVLGLLVNVETVIQRAHLVSLANLIFAPKIKSPLLEAATRDREAWLQTVSPEQRKLFESRFSAFQNGIVAHTITGAPLGWILFVPFLLVGLAVAAGQAISKRAAIPVQGLRVVLQPAVILLMACLPHMIRTNVAAAFRLDRPDQRQLAQLG